MSPRRGLGINQGDAVLQICRAAGAGRARRASKSQSAAPEGDIFVATSPPTNSSSSEERHDCAWQGETPCVTGCPGIHHGHQGVRLAFQMARKFSRNFRLRLS